MAERLLEWIADLHGVVLVLMIGGLAFGESSVGLDFVVPGEAGMVVGGAALARADIPLWVAVPVAALGAALGDGLSFFLGRRFGTDLVCSTRWGRRHLGPQLGRAQRYFDDKGGRAVFLARWVGALRAVMPFVAGTAGMPVGRFVAWNVAAAVAWTTVMLTLGYVVGEQIARTVDRAGLAVSLVAVALLVTWLVVREVRRRRRARDGAQPAVAEAT